MMLSLFEVVEKRRHPGCDCATVSTAVRSSDDDYQSNQTEAEATMATPSNTDSSEDPSHNSNQETSVDPEPVDPQSPSCELGISLTPLSPPCQPTNIIFPKSSSSGRSFNPHWYSSLHGWNIQ